MLVLYICMYIRYMHLSVYSFITHTLIFFLRFHGANKDTAVLTETGTSKGLIRIIFYFVPANNWPSHVKYHMANLIQRVALFVAKIYTRVPIVGAERIADDKNFILSDTELVLTPRQIVVIVISLVAHRKRERVVNVTSTSNSCILRVYAFGEATMFH